MVDSATDDSPAPSDIPSNPLRTGRVWTVALWALVFALFTAGVDQTLQDVRHRAEDLALLILPEESLREAERNEMLAEVRSSTVVKSARWISPEALAKEASRSIPRNLGSSLLDGQGDSPPPWIPWIAEVRFERPLDRADKIEKEVTKFKALAGVRWIAWDSPKLQGEAQLQQRIRRSASFLGFLIIGVGIAALAFQDPGENAFGRAWLASVSLTLGLCAVALLGLSFAGWDTDARAGSLIFSVGFLLAGAVDPMLKKFTVKEIEKDMGS